MLSEGLARAKFDGPAMFSALSRVSASLLLAKYGEYRLLDWGFQDLQGLLGKEKLRAVDKTYTELKHRQYSFNQTSPH